MNPRVCGTLSSRMQSFASQIRKYIAKGDWFAPSLWFLLFMGVIVRIIKMPLMEFKGDEFHFLTQSFLHPFALSQIHDVRSAFPIPHPPSFAYFLAFPVSLTVDPIAITAFIAWVNIIALWLFYGFCRRLFAKEAALISTALLASMPWAVIFSRKIWNPDLVFPCQIVFLIALEHLVRAYKPWKLYVFVVALVLFLQAHLLSLFSIIPVAVVLYIAKLPIQKSEKVRASALFFALFLPYLSYMFGFEGTGPASISKTLSESGVSGDIMLHNLQWWMQTSTGLGFEYLLGDSGYASFLDLYHLAWAPYVFMVYITAAICALVWILTKMLGDMLWFQKEGYPPFLLVLLFLVLWSIVLPVLLTTAHKIGYPHYWVSIIIVFPICFGVMSHSVLRLLPVLWKNIARAFIVLCVATQVIFMLSLYGFLEHHHEKITGDYGVPYQFEKENWEAAIENAAIDMQ